MSASSIELRSELDLLRERVVAQSEAVGVEAWDRAVDWVSRVSAPNRLSRGVHAARVLANLRLDVATVVAGLLAPQLEEGVPKTRDWPPVDPKPDVGVEIIRLLEGVGRIKAIRWYALGTESVERLRRMVLAIASDVRVVLVALADRLESLREARDLEPSDRRRLATEVQEVFAPLANRLGIWQIKWELEDLALRELDPDTYKGISRLLSETRAQRDSYINDMIALFMRELEQAGIQGRVTGRPKHIYSIFKKMQRKQVGFDQIYDMSAVRVVVDEVRDCYAVLGLVHGMWAPVPGEFDDYIAKPKPNLYQSLHTAVVGPEGKTLEIQIRTQKMHDYAEFGVAAHWAYKEGRPPAGSGHQFHLLRQLMDWQKDLSDPSHLVDALRGDLFVDRVYAFTPEGDVLELPLGATPLDFAYRVHTQLGHRCSGARINDQIVPLDRPIKTGDRVEVRTRKHAAPSRDWLDPHLGYVHTASARQKIRQWFRKQNRDEAVAQGRELVDKELGRLGLRSPDLKVLAVGLGYSKAEELLAAIGFGDVGTHRVGARALEAERRAEAPEESEKPEPPEIKRRSGERRAGGAKGVRVDGVGEVLSHPARCCTPVPGDSVVGYISRGRGLVIHHRDCPNVRDRADPERFLDIEWGRASRARYPVSLRVRARERRGLVRDVVEVISLCGAEVRATSVEIVARGDEAAVTATVEAGHSEQLVKVI
ncbi:MAG: bifunctional (p)ppGpp synthetase/guanosine-3',5'-bis(diphosphate) 3'-pyrophosphohydrolase, partial [Nannocystaceae bacterium]